MYNYADFVKTNHDTEFNDFRNNVHVTSRVPSFPLEDLASGEISELKRVWAKGPAILEFGSLT